MMNRDEWFTAADGLVAIDPTTDVNGNAPGEHRCNTQSSGPRNTGLGTACASSWGVQDMIGNLWEFTDEWYSSVGQITSMNGAFQPASGYRVNDGLHPWPAGFGNDITVNVSAVVYSHNGDNQTGMPAVGVRGGAWGEGTGSGIFAFSLYGNPAQDVGFDGFRCVISP